MATKLERITELPYVIKVTDDTLLGGVPAPIDCELREAKQRLIRCRVPAKIPAGTYSRRRSNSSVSILESVRYGQRWRAPICWITRTRNLLPRRLLYSPQLPLEVAPPDLTRPCIHPNAPSHLASVWRYMDLWKLESMLEQGGIFLSRSDQVNDAREASLSIANLRYRARVYRNRPKVARRFEKLVHELPNIKRFTYISCWRVDEEEDERTWSEYANNDSAVAIKTTYRKLLYRTATIFCAGVEYIDYVDDWVVETCSVWPFAYKAKAHEWEREFRIIIQQFPRANISFADALFCDCSRENPNCGIIVSANLSELITKIVIGPACSAVSRERLKSVVAHYGLSDRVSESTFR
jgi:hypothetical protein